MIYRSALLLEYAIEYGPLSLLLSTPSKSVQRGAIVTVLDSYQTG